LRYLKLGGELEPELLEGIGNLKLLKTLDLEGVHIAELPACIVQLRQLECLLVRGGSKFPDGIGNLTSLQELSMLNVHNSPNTVAELGELRELRVLTVEGFEKNESYMETFLLSLSNLGNLRTLNFCGSCGPCSINSVTDQWRGPARLQVFNGSAVVFSELPRWFSTLSELSCLSIMVNLLRQVDIQLLGALPVLRFLDLTVQTGGTTEERLVIGSDQPFRSLAEFKLTHRSRCWLPFGQGVMPRLQRLELYFPAVKNVGGGFDAAGLENLTSLKHVTFRVCCEGARVRDLEEVETKIRGAVDGHPNHPALVLSRYVCLLIGVYICT
jgi:disease resistance protein RPM1